MPTGYTAAIKDGISFEQYALSCARAFGALVVTRDEPADAPIPNELEPSFFNKKALEEAEEKLRILRLLSDEGCHREMEKERQGLIDSAQKQIADNNDLHCKYLHLLAQTKAYLPPSPDHEEFKKFMVDQIEQSIDFDCRGNYYTDELKKFPASVGEWRNKKIDKLMQDISYHTKENAEEINMTNSRNLWIKQLRESLEKP
jgi:hypothetical protein